MPVFRGVTVPCRHRIQSRARALVAATVLAALGRDPREWSGFRTCVSVYELWVTAWAVGAAVYFACASFGGTLPSLLSALLVYQLTARRR